MKKERTRFDEFLEMAAIWAAFWTNVAVVAYRQIREKILEQVR